MTNHRTLLSTPWYEYFSHNLLAGSNVCIKLVRAYIIYFRVARIKIHGARFF